MSQISDHANSVRRMLEKYPQQPKMVIDIIMEPIENQDGWSDENKMGMLRAGKGISYEIDVEIENYIALNYSYSVKDLTLGLGMSNEQREKM